MLKSNELKLLLRVQDEPCITISDIQTHTILMKNSVKFMDELKKSYLVWSSGEKWVDIPKKIVLSTPNIKGDFRVMPCMTNINGGIKTVKVIGTNEENRYIKDKISVGKLLLVDWYDNYVYAIIDACILSSFRTAAISVLAYSIKSNKIHSVGLIGLGRVGIYTAFLLHKWLGVNSIICNDKNPKIIQNFKKLISVYAPDLKIIIQDNIDLIKSSNSLFLATDSQNHLLDNSNSTNLSFISSVGADANNLCELDESVVSNKMIITDSLQSMLLGDMKVWVEKGVISNKDVSELKHIITDSLDNQDVVFISTGVALQDALIAKFIYEKYSENENNA
ncbi:MAG: hypothetical protein DRG78_16220 [Epsilonproteobacteria bacterium]|nr:MAG: hypothetical protein DRG78_16220 [Campylobacterota bacterium]